MQTLNSSDAGFEAAFRQLCRRPSYPAAIEADVTAILDGVKARGDAALSEYAKRFDRADLAPGDFLVTAEPPEPDAGFKEAILAALEHVRDFARRQCPKAWSCNPRPGVTLGEQFTPMDRIGVYVPGGTAPLVSTVIHTAGIASACGVREIVAVTPPGPDGGINAATHYAMKQAGVTEIYRLGGVYGIAALAFGSESVRPVEKIVGPGNAYVTAAKKLVYGQVAIDMVAGPSEILVIADDSASARCVAADLLSQAEHGSGLEQAVVIGLSQPFLDAVAAEVERQKALLPREATVDRVLTDGAFLILAKDLDQAAGLAGRYAPEHLELCCAGARELAGKIRAAGAIFIGHWTPEPIGDFCAGPSHVLPTAGSARFFSGLAAEAFFRRSSLIEYTEEALRREAPYAARFAEMEGLAAHGKSAVCRLD